MPNSDIPGVTKGRSFKDMLYKEITLLVAGVAAVWAVFGAFNTPINVNAGDIREIKFRIEQIEETQTEGEIKVEKLSAQIAEIRESVIRIEAKLQ